MWVVYGLCFPLLVNMGSTRMNLWGRVDSFLCIRVQRDVYQMWQHLAECGIALSMYKRYYECETSNSIDVCIFVSI